MGLIERDICRCEPFPNARRTVAYQCPHCHRFRNDLPDDIPVKRGTKFPCGCVVEFSRWQMCPAHGLAKKAIKVLEGIVYEGANSFTIDAAHEVVEAYRRGMRKEKV